MGKKNIVWNDYISKNERFADFVNGVVFNGEQLVRPEALTALDTKLRRRERRKDSYQEFIRDMAKVWEYQGKRYVLGLEPEESPHLALPVKYMNYESLEYDRQYKETVNGGNVKLELNKEDYRTKEGMDMCTALRELEEDARAEGREEGSHLMNELNRRLMQDGRTEDLFRSIQDAEYQKELMKEYGLER